MSEGLKSTLMTPCFPIITVSLKNMFMSISCLYKSIMQFIYSDTDIVPVSSVFVVSASKVTTMKQNLYIPFILLMKHNVSIDVHFALHYKVHFCVLCSLCLPDHGTLALKRVSCRLVPGPIYVRTGHK